MNGEKKSVNATEITNQELELKIFGIIFKTGDTFEIATDFSLTEEETQAIMDILANHQNEGGSIAGLDKEEMEECLKDCCQNE